MKHKLSTSLALFAIATLVATPLLAQMDQKTDAPAPQKKQAPRGRASPHETVGAVVDGNRVTVVYGRPYSARAGKGEPRKIWGALVPYGERWRMGADEATLLITQKPLQIGDATVPAGAYSLHLFPNADGTAKLAINKQIGQWGIPARGQDPKEVYQESNDVARVDLKREDLAESVDQFTISVESSRSGGGTLKLMWEKTAYSVPLKSKA